MKEELDRAYLKRPVGDPPDLPATRPVAVLIVNRGSRESLQDCLRGVAEHLPELAVYVYDDDGADDDPARAALASKHPAVHWVSGANSVGFAAACNVLVEHAPADADLLLLDSHARVLGPLTRTRELLRQPRVAAVSPLVRDDSAPARAPWDVAVRRRTVLRELSAAAGRSGLATPHTLLGAVRPPASRITKSGR